MQLIGELKYGKYADNFDKVHPEILERYDDEVLDEAKGQPTQGFKKHVVCFTTRHKIPSVLYKNGWEDAIKRAVGGEYLDSESEVEEKSCTRKGKTTGRRTASPIEPQSESSGAESSEANDLQVIDVKVKLEVEDHGMSRHRSARLSQAPVVKAKVDNNFDLARIFEVSQAPHLSFLHLPRLGGWKQEKSVGVVQRPLINGDNDGSSYGSPSPFLRPVTSSFQFDPAVGSSTSTINSAMASTTLTSHNFNTISFGAPTTSSSTAPSTSNSAASISSSLSSSLIHRAKKPMLRKYIPSPPKGGLKIPKPTSDPWA
ncbi:hypothetical protein B0H10DRAFT_2221080 [Mycena sp. CBHHK59/15]|nr:hypothetical protein B0H10DRAFT_2221080 [Mycena sp. CBHHK59/15]